jgi:hypothetical protein
MCEGKTVNKEMYIDILHHLRDGVSRKCPEKWRINSSFLLHENAPAHQLVLVEDFSKEQCENTGASPILS